MKITRSSVLGTKRGAEEYFTGAVWLEDLSGGVTAKLRVLRVSFEPGARTAWHTHPHGQLLNVVSGVARVQKSGEPVVELFPGDVVWFEPGERHWHGAAPDRPMAHLAVQETDEEGNSATWLEPVSDADYRGATK